MQFTESKIEVAPNIRLAVRRYDGGGKTPAICLHGLTRNAADFEDIAPVIAQTGRDVLAISFRGRGESDRDPNYLNYHPLTYRDDVFSVLDAAAIDRAIFVGTSLGGLTTMLANELKPEGVRAAILNDVGPELAPEGLARIGGYVGGDPEPVSTIEEAAQRIKAINSIAFPGYDDAAWVKFARRTYRQLDDDKWVLDYDPKIATALSEVGPAPELWPAFESLKDTPTLVVRGATSDLLTPPIIDKMRAVHPNFDYVEAPNVGHAPMLSEPPVEDAIRAFLSRID